MNLHIRVCLMFFTLALKGTCLGEQDSGNVTHNQEEQTTVSDSTSFQTTEDVKVKERSTSLKYTAENYPPSLNITCAIRGAMAVPLNDTTQDSLNITNFTISEYACTAFNKTLTISLNITVIYALKILNSSVLLDSVLKCSSNLSLPMHLVLHFHHTQSEESIMHSNITLQEPKNWTFHDGEEFVCENNADRKQTNLDIDTGNKDSEVKSTRNDFTKLDIRTFLICAVGVTSSGLIISAVLCVVLLWTSYRTHKNIQAHTNKEGLSIESQRSQEDVDLTGADDHVPLQRQTAEENTCPAACTSSKEDRDIVEQNEIPEGGEAAEGGTREVDYACINFYLLQNGDGEAQIPQGEETEYSEIQLKARGEGEGKGEGAECLHSREDQPEGGIESQMQVELEERDSLEIVL